MNKIKLIATDLDGTFLNNDKSISEQNRFALEELGKKKIIRVAATGRNLNKVNEVIPPDLPFDYIIFSSGAGIFDWQKKQHLFKQNISVETSSQLAGFLIQKDLNFTAFQAVPENHKLWYHRGSKYCDEYERYFAFHSSYAQKLPENGNFENSLCQFLVVLPDDPVWFESLKKEIEELFSEIGVIRSTSPLGTGFIWMELFHKSISKGNALSFICEKLGIKTDETVGIGNDFNDLDLLNFTRHSFLVANSPDELKPGFVLAPSNEEHAFSFVANQFF